MTLANPKDGVLLPYQRELARAIAEHEVVVYEKSRRIGATWGIAADAVLTAAAAPTARGMDVFYIGFNLDMTREFIDTCAMWAKEFLGVVAEAREFLYRDGDESVQAFRINFASGFEIVALSSRPRSLRGRQGYVIIDEAAFHDELDELLKAALALLIWGGKVVVLSTHNGVESAFNSLVTECRTEASRASAGKKKRKLIRVTFDEALRQGLYRRICLKLKRPWSPGAEAEWAEGVRRTYGDAASEELDCIPRASGGRYLPRTLLEGRAVDVPVLRLKLDDRFVDKPEEQRESIIRAWCDDDLAPLLVGIKGRSFVGEDFGRSGDLTVLWPLVVDQQLRRSTPFVVELRNVPFKAQEQILFFLISHLPGFAGAALDARGNGQYLAEVTRQKYGAVCVAEVMLSEGWYRDNAPRLKAALEDGSLSVPKDLDVIDDLHSLEVIRGVGRPPEKARQTPSGQRHADAAVAVMLAVFASLEIESGPITISVAGAHEATTAFSECPELSSRSYAGWDL